jgi:hypothetical protein
MTAQERDAYHIVVFETEKWLLQALHIRVTLTVIDIRTNCYHSSSAKVIHGSEAFFYQQSERGRKQMSSLTQEIADKANGSSSTLPWLNTNSRRCLELARPYAEQTISGGPSASKDELAKNKIVPMAL